MLPRRYLEGQPGLLASHSCSLSCVFRDHKVLLFQACVLAPRGGETCKYNVLEPSGALPKSSGCGPRFCVAGLQRRWYPRNPMPGCPGGLPWIWSPRQVLVSVGGGAAVEKKTGG